MGKRYSLSDLSELLGLSPKGYRQLREGARLGAFGQVVETYARAQFWEEDSIYRASLFLTLNTRLGFSAPMAAEMILASGETQKSGLAEAIAAVRRGERWRFEIQHLSREAVPYCHFTPWDRARSGLPTTQIPLARTVVDLSIAWGWIAPRLADE